MRGFSQFVKRRTVLCALVLLGLLLFSVVLAVGIGPVGIGFATVWRVMLHNLLDLFGLGGAVPLEGVRESTRNIVWFLRAPRVLLGGLVGASLTLSGVGMQAFTKNPLAEPYVLGISSGASLGAVLAMLVGVWLPLGGRLSVPAGAFLGALISMLLVYQLARSGDGVTPVRLILVGVAVSAIFSAFTNYIVYTAPNDAAVREATFWMLGGFGSAKWEDTPLLAILILPAFFLLLALSKPLNAMMMGDSSAITLGVDLGLVRKLLIVVTALLTASSVAVSGCIGFVGLVIPHIVRAVTGADHKRLIPLSTLCGALFMIWVDVGARMLHPPTEIPVGILTAFLGAPLFLWMIKWRRYEFK
ncbi:MAG: iron ABC transporter permease [Oscillospiraceae bacterium]